MPQALSPNVKCPKKKRHYVRRMIILARHQLSWMFVSRWEELAAHSMASLANAIIAAAEEEHCNGRLTGVQPSEAGRPQPLQIRDVKAIARTGQVIAHISDTLARLIVGCEKWVLKWRP